MSDVRRPQEPDPRTGIGMGIDYELDAELDADTPERLKALADPLRSMICDLVLQRSMSVTQLADELARPRGTVAHHVKVLVDAGLLRVVRTRRVRAMTERFYGRTARTYVMSSAEGELPFFGALRNSYPTRRPPHDPTSPRSHRDGLATIRHARISAERFEEYVARLHALSLEFSAEPRADGDADEYGIYLLAFRSARLPK